MTPVALLPQPERTARHKMVTKSDPSRSAREAGPYELNLEVVPTATDSKVKDIKSPHAL